MHDFSSLRNFKSVYDVFRLTLTTGGVNLERKIQDKICRRFLKAYVIF